MATKSKERENNTRYENRQKPGTVDKNIKLARTEKGDNMLFVPLRDVQGFARLPGRAALALTMSSTPMPIRMKGRIGDSDVKGMSDAWGVRARRIGNNEKRTAGGTRGRWCTSGGRRGVWSSFQ